MKASQKSPLLLLNQDKSGRPEARATVSRLLRRHWRKAAGLSLIGLSLAAFAVIAFRKKAAEAYLTGDVITIKSPIQGQVVSDDVSSGELFEAGREIIAVVASRQDEAKQQNAKLELEQTQREIRAAASELRMLTAANRARIQNDLQAAEKELLDLQGQRLRYQIQAERYRQLVKDGAVDRDTLAGSEAAANSFEQRYANQRRVVSNLKQELSDAQAKIAIGNQTLPRSMQRLEMLELEISRLNNQLTNLHAKKRRLAALVSANEQRSVFRYRPVFNGLVLSNRISKGSEVGVGEPVMTVINCDRLKVEAVFSAEKVRSVQPGDVVSVKIGRQSEMLQGRVISMRGVKGIRALESLDAAQFKATSEDRMRLQIALPPRSEVLKDCRLGERVDVEL